MARVLVPEAVGDKQLDGSTEKFAAVVAEQALGLGVYEDDVATAVDDDHSVGGAFEQGTETVVGTPALGHVAGDAGRPDRAPLPVPDRGDRHGHVDAGAVFADADGLVMQHRVAPRRTASSISVSSRRRSGGTTSSMVSPTTSSAR